MGFYATSVCGQNFQWVNTLGGAKATTLPANQGNATTGSCKDNDGNIIVVGYYSDTADFDPGPGKTILTIYDTNGYRQNLFYAKYTQAGQLVWAKTMYGTGLNRANAVVVDNEGNIFFGGLAEGGISPDTGAIGPGNPLLLDEGFGGSYQGFLVKVNSMGNFMAGRRFGGRNTEVKAISVGEDGSLYITGQYVLASRFNYGLGNDTLGDIGDPVFKGNFYFARFGNDLSFRWVRGIGNKTFNQCNTIVVNKDKSFYLAGGGRDTLDFDPGVASYFINPPGTNGALTYGFFAKYDSLGRFLFVRPLLGGGVVNTLKKDCLENIYLGGSGPQSMDFDPGPDSAFLMQWFSGFFIAKYDSVTNLKWGFGMGGDGGLDYMSSICIDSTGSAICTGRFTGRVDFDPGVAVVNLSSLGYQNQISVTDVFLSKISNRGNLIWARRMGSFGSDLCNVVLLDSNQNIYTGGSYIGTVDFDMLSGVQNRTSLNATDAYLAKYSQCITRTQVKDTICAGSSRVFDGETLTKPGKYIRLKSYNAVTNCEVWEELFLQVRPVLNASAGKDSSLCTGKTVRLGNDSVTSLSYNWQQIGGSFSSTKAQPVINLSNETDTSQRIRFALAVSQNGTGCSFYDTVSIRINPRKRTSQSDTICKGQIFRVGANAYTLSGIYTDTLSAVSACDSIVTTRLFITAPNDTISIGPNLLSVAPNQDGYQWLQCPGFTAISNETSSTFSPALNGQYAVKVTKGNCTDTSACVLFTSTKSLITDQIRMYPQPVKDRLFIDIPNQRQIARLTIMDALGKVVLIQKDWNPDWISVAHLPSGLYLVKLEMESELKVLEMVIEK